MFDAKVFDGDYKIIYSRDFNIYENKLTINSIRGFLIEFIFEKDPTTLGLPPLKIEGDNTNKKVKIILTNFNNTLGAGTTKRIPIINSEDGSQVYFSIHAKSLDENSSFLKVSVTFYSK